MRGDSVRVGKVFEDEVPLSRILVPGRIKAAWHKKRWHRRGNLPVKRNLLAPCAPLTVRLFEEPCFEYQRSRCIASGTLVCQPQSRDLRKNGRARAFDRDVGDTPLAKHLGPAKRVSKVFRLGRFW